MIENTLILHERVKKIAVEKILPNAKKVDELGGFPKENFQVLVDNKLFGLHIPIEYGGTDEGFQASAIAVEEIAKVCASTSVLLCTQALTTYSVYLGGNEEQKKKYLYPLAKGNFPGALCITELEAGSDVSNIQTTAEKIDDYYVLNGQKIFITNAGEAGIYLILARTSEHRSKGLSFFVVENSMDGLSFGESNETLGVRGSAVRSVVLENVKVPKENLLGNEGEGFKILMNVFNRSRTLVGSQAVGIAKGAFHIAVDYLKTRTQFGRPLSDQQMIQGMIAELGTLIETASLLVREAAIQIDNDADQIEKYASMAKYYASDVAMKVTTDAVQLLGGNGYSTKYPLERMMRDAKVTQIYDGTNQIQKLIVARKLLS